MEIMSFQKSNEPSKHKSQIEEIFFLSTSKTFESTEERTRFFNNWTAYYFSQYPHLIFIALDKNSNVLAYITICPDSKAALGVLPIKSYSLFADLFQEYPAHLHINAHPKARGMGLGSRLIEHACNHLKQKNIKGLHLVTSPDSKNVSFYKRNKFHYEKESKWGESTLLFLGKKIRT